MAAPTFQAVGTQVTNAGPISSPVSPAWPAHAADDVALLLVETAGDGNLALRFNSNTTTGNGGGVHMATGAKGPAGSSGTVEATHIASMVTAMLTLALKPAGSVAPTYQAVGSLGGSTTTLSPAWPTHVAGDIALLLVESANEAVTLSSAQGFVEVGSSPQGVGTAGGTDATRLTVFWCRATSSSMTAPTIADAGDHVIARIATFRGCVTSGDPVDVTAGSVKGTASATSTMPAVTTTTDHTLVCYMLASDRDATGANTTNMINSGELGVYLSDPQGFVEVTHSPQQTGTPAASGSTQLSVFWCRATSSSMATPEVAGHGDHVIAVIVTFRGCVTNGNPWNTTAGDVKATASTSSTMPAVTTTVVDTLIALCIANAEDTTGGRITSMTNAALSSLTERADSNSNVGTGGGISVWTGGLAAAGSSGTTAVVHVGSSTAAMLTIALAATAAPTGFRHAWGAVVG